MPSTTKIPEPALIFDTPGVFARGFYASRGSEELHHLPSERAAACAALMVLLPILSGARLDETYRVALFCWDGARKTDKPRDPKPDGYEAAMDYFRDLLPRLVGGAHFTPPGFESDDACATAAVRSSLAGSRCCVVSGDKDLQQLACRDVAYYCLNSKSFLSTKHIMEHWDVRHPSQLAVRLAVVGDPKDGIGGVLNWGKKKWTDKIMDKLPLGADLGDLISHVLSCIPVDQHDNFYRSLESTLLNVDVPDVPEPSELVPAPVELLESEGLRDVRSFYARFVGEFTGAIDARSDVDADY